MKSDNLKVVFIASVYSTLLFEKKMAMVRGDALRVEELDKKLEYLYEKYPSECFQFEGIDANSIIDLSI